MNYTKSVKQISKAKDAQKVKQMLNTDEKWQRVDLNYRPRAY